MSSTSTTADAGGLILGLRSRQVRRAIGFVDDAEAGLDEGSDKYVRYRGEGHLLTIGATGSSKTTGPAICNALTHPGQLVCLEGKGDIFAATADRRRDMGQEVHLLDLREDNPLSGAFNPLDAAALCGGDSGLRARSVAAAMVTRAPNEDVFWVNWAETLLTSSLALNMELQPPGQQTLSAVFDFLHQADTSYDIYKKLQEHENLSRSARSGLAAFLELPERETRPSVLASTQQHLRLWESDLVRRLTDHTSFDLQAFLDGKPMSIYIVSPPFRLTAYAPVLKLWLGTLMAALMTRTRVPEHRTLMMCDEVGALGSFDALVAASTLLRSSGLTLWTFWQNAAQLDAVYGTHARTLTDNVGVLQLLGARNRRMASEYATLCGGIDADDIMAMGEDECLALIDGRRMERMRRARYFEQDDLLALARAGRSA